MFPTNSERLIGISDAFSAFCLRVSVIFPTCSLYQKQKRAYSALHPQALTYIYRSMLEGTYRVQSLDFRRSSITAQVNTKVGYITSNRSSLRETRCTCCKCPSSILLVIQYVSGSVWFLLLLLLLFLPKAIFCIVYTHDCALPGLDLFSQGKRSATTQRHPVLNWTQEHCLLFGSLSYNNKLFLKLVLRSCCCRTPRWQVSFRKLDTS